jgi:hypothetical protein
LSPYEEIERATSNIDDRWELKEGRIVKSFHYPSFMKANV